jgi:hypothetical protein
MHLLVAPGHAHGPGARVLHALQRARRRARPGPRAGHGDAPAPGLRRFSVRPIEKTALGGACAPPGPKHFGMILGAWQGGVPAGGTRLGPGRSRRRRSVRPVGLCDGAWSAQSSMHGAAPSWVPPPRPQAMQPPAAAHAARPPAGPAPHLPFETPRGGRAWRPGNPRGRRGCRRAGRRGRGAGAVVGRGMLRAKAAGALGGGS